MKKANNKFNSSFGFILAAAGSSVGLGNLWSFPYKTSQNGGAAFVIIYLISVLLFASFMSIAEIYIGKRAQANTVTAYKKIHKNLGWVGLLAIVAALIVIFYYSILGGYAVKFTVNSFSDNSDILKSFSNNGWEPILFTAIFLLLAVIIISLGVKKGIENASKILMPILIIALIGIVIYCLCLGEGVTEGLAFYLKPDFKEIGFKGILAAVGQAFFSLSVGVGCLTAYGSYMGQDFKIGRSMMWVAIFDSMVALLAGLAIFPAIYNYKAQTGIELQNNGIVLLFSSMPIIFAKLGIGGKILSFVFFGMVSIAAITSVISVLEAVTQFLIQRFQLKRKIVSTILAVVALICSIPISLSLGHSINDENILLIGNKSLLEVLDTIINSLFIPVIALNICIGIGWVLFKPKNKKELFSTNALADNLRRDGLNLGKMNNVFAFIIKYVALILILIIEVAGMIDAMFPIIDGKRQFVWGGFITIMIGIVVLAITITIYFVFLENKETGTNDDEIA